MTYLLDTNVLSETRRTRPEPRVLAWLGATPGDTLFISVLTLGKLREGVAAKRRQDVEAALRIEQWVDQIEAIYGDRIIHVDPPIARRWGELAAARPVPVIDSLIAATALARGLVVVTRNAVDMQAMGVPLINPWLDEAP